MSDNFLANLSLSDEEKEKISNLAVSSPAGLLAMIRASQEAFKSLLGKDRLSHLTAELEASISKDELQILSRPSEEFNATGAVIGKTAPEIAPPEYDLAERDRLFQRLQRLRQSNDKSPELRRQIAGLEQRLNDLLETRD